MAGTSSNDLIGRDAAIKSELAPQFGENAKIRIARTFEDYFGGTLRQVEIDDNGNKQQRYCLSLKTENKWFGNVEEVFQWSAGADERKKLFPNLDFGSAVTGFIAITIVCLIGFWALVIRGDPPGYLGNALTVILGFYFGRASTTVPPA
jgi:hypothetical protein